MRAKKESFAAHLRRLRAARARADAILARSPAVDELTQRVQRLAWALLYDYLCLNADNLDPAQLRHIGDIALKFARARQLAEDGGKAGAEAAPGPKTAGLPDDLRAALERELGLLG